MWIHFCPLYLLSSHFGQQESHWGHLLKDSGYYFKQEKGGNTVFFHSEISGSTCCFAKRMGSWLVLQVTVSEVRHFWSNFLCHSMRNYWKPASSVGPKLLQAPVLTDAGRVFWWSLMIPHFPKGSTNLGIPSAEKRACCARPASATDERPTPTSAF